MKTYIDKVVEMVKKETGLKSKNLVRIYALLVLIKGEQITLKDVHDGWSLDMNYKEPNPPYCYGHDHLSIVPFSKLSKETQERDRKYVDALKKVARQLKNE